jgi:hypothetical protein
MSLGGCPQGRVRRLANWVEPRRAANRVGTPGDVAARAGDACVQRVDDRLDAHNSCRRRRSRAAGVAGDRDAQCSRPGENGRGPAGALGVGRVPSGRSPQPLRRLRRQHDPERQRPGGGRITMRLNCLGSGAVEPPCPKHHGSASGWSSGPRVATARECDHRLRRSTGGPVAGHHRPVSSLPSRIARRKRTARRKGIMRTAPRRLPQVSQDVRSPDRLEPGSRIRTHKPESGSSRRDTRERLHLRERRADGLCQQSPSPRRVDQQQR